MTASAALVWILLSGQIPVERLIDQGRLAEARLSLEQLRLVEPDARRVALLEAMILYREGTPDQALLRLVPQLDANDGLADSYKLAALCLVAVGKPREAGPYIQQAVRLMPDDAMAHYYLGLSQLDLRQSENAVESLRRSVRLNESYPDAHVMLGLALEESAHEDQAEASYRLGVELTEKLKLRRETSFVYLGRFLQARGRNEEALPFLSKATEANPRSAEAWLLMGKARLELGRLDSALAALQKAVELAPNDKRPRYQLMRAYQRLGRPDDARRERESYQRMTTQELSRWERSVLDAEHVK